MKKHLHGRVIWHGVSEAKEREDSFHAEQGIAGSIEVWLCSDQISIHIQCNWSRSLSEKEDTNTEMEKIRKHSMNKFN